MTPTRRGAQRGARALVERRRYMMVAPVVIRPATLRPLGIPGPLASRTVLPRDRDALAALMLDAYRGTIDFDGDETLEDAVQEVDGVLAGCAGPALLSASYVALAGTALASATLVTLAQGQPLLAYVYTASRWKNRGLAGALIQMSMNALARQGHTTLRLAVTAGNAPAEHLYRRLGFVPKP